MNETWKPVPDYEEQYECSSFGRFRRIGRDKLLAVTISKKHGYAYVRLSKGGKARNIRAHRLILLAHVGPKPTPFHEARHLDGMKANNRADNLLWGTGVENSADKAQHGTLRGARPGEGHHNAVLTAREVESIRTLYRNGVKQAEIARRFEISQSNVSRIVSGESWQSHEATKRTEARL